MSAQAEQFYDQLRSAVETDQLKLPSLPDVALNVRQAVDNDKHSSEQIAAIIGRDPSMAARLLQLANSPLYRARSAIDNLPMAITRLGARIVRDLVTTLAMRQLFQADTQVLDAHFRELWSSSVRIAAFSRTLVRVRPGLELEPEQAMLAGLIHNIGALPVIMLARNEPDLVDDRQALRALTRELQGRVGSMILSFWHFPPSLIDVVALCNDWQREHAGDADYVDVVQVALLESAYPEPPPTIEPPAAYAKLGVDGYGGLVSDENHSAEINQALQSLIGP